MTSFADNILLKDIAFDRASLSSQSRKLNAYMKSTKGCIIDEYFIIFYCIKDRFDLLINI
jgi:hypothetical protein